MLLNNQASQVADWMLERRVHAWAESNDVLVGDAPVGRDSKRAEFVLESRNGVDAVECKRLNTVPDSDEALKTWVRKRFPRASKQLAASAERDTAARTLVLDVSMAANEVVQRPVPGGTNLMLWKMSEDRARAVARTARRAAERHHIDTVVVACDERFFLNDRPAAPTRRRR